MNKGAPLACRHMRPGGLRRWHSLPAGGPVRFGASVASRRRFLGHCATYRGWPGQPVRREADLSGHAMYRVQAASRISPMHEWIFRLSTHRRTRAAAGAQVAILTPRRERWTEFRRRETAVADCSA